MARKEFAVFGVSGICTPGRLKSAGTCAPFTSVPPTKPYTSYTQLGSTANLAALQLQQVPEKRYFEVVTPAGVFSIVLGGGGSRLIGLTAAQLSSNTALGLDLLY
jgi:hypothetical protein